MEKSKIKSLSVAADMSIKGAMQRLTETANKILFVTDSEDVLLGTVTDGDIRRGIINGRPLTDTVREIMNTKFFSISAGSPDIHKEARDLMQKYHIDHIPVVDEKGMILDVISWIDCINPEAGHPHKTEDMSQHPVVIMAGGKGTRLDPFTKILPKPLIPLENKPIIEHIMDRFNRNGFARFILVLNYKKELIKMYFSDNKPPYDIELLEEEDYYGTAGGLSLLKGRLNNTFVVTNCDTILVGEYTDFFKWHKERGNLLTVVGSHREIQVPYGVLNMNNGLLVEIDEKPRIDIFINTGTYIFEPRVLDYIEDNKRIDIDKLIDKVKAEHQDRVGVYPHWGGWFDIGQWDEYRRSLKKIGEQVDEL